MEVEFTDVARRDMADRGIHRTEVEATLTSPDAVDEGDVLVRHEARIADRSVVVYTVRDSDPLLVMLVRGGTE